MYAGSHSVFSSIAHCPELRCVLFLYSCRNLLVRESRDSLLSCTLSLSILCFNTFHNVIFKLTELWATTATKPRCRNALPNCNCTSAWPTVTVKTVLLAVVEKAARSEMQRRASARARSNARNKVQAMRPRNNLVRFSFYL